MNYKLYSLDNDFIKECIYFPKNFTGIIEYRNKTRAWLNNSKFHRFDGPAIEFIGGAKAWYKKGILHNLNGHAFEYHDGHKEYWIYDKRITEEQHKLLRDIMKLKKLT